MAKKDNTLYFLLLLAIAGGGAYYYFKVYKPQMDAKKPMGKVGSNGPDVPVCL